MTKKEFELLGAIPGQYLILHSISMGISVIHYTGHDSHSIHANWSVNLGSNYTSTQSSSPLTEIDRVTFIPGA